MRRRKIAIISIVIIIGLIIAVTIDLRIKYNVGLFDYIEYNSALTPAEEILVKEKP